MVNVERAPLSVELDDLGNAKLAAKYLKVHNRLIDQPLERPVSPLVIILERTRGKKLARAIGQEYGDVQDLLPAFAANLVELAGAVGGR